VRLTTTIRRVVPPAVLVVSAWALSAPASDARSFEPRQEARRTVVPCGDVTALVNAIESANTAGSGTIILGSECQYTLTEPAVDPGGHGPDGLPVITGEVTIWGRDSTITRAAAAPAFRVAEIAPGGKLTLARATVSGGSATNGGGILNRGTLVLQRGNVTDNTASNIGGGIAVASNAEARLDGSDVKGNTGGDGGGVHVNTSASLTVNNGSVSHNTATVLGGGVANNGTAELNYVTVKGNQTELFEGGGIWTATGPFTVAGGEIEGNEASYGGGVANLGSSLSMTSATVSGNTAREQGGGLYNNRGTTQLIQGEITENVALGGEGGGIFIDGGNVTRSGTDAEDNDPDDCAPSAQCP
jgi:hypothetical protein